MRSSLVALASSILLWSQPCRAADSTATDTLRLRPDEFRYGGDPRYTVLGDTPLRETDIRVLPTIGLGVGVAALGVGLHITQSNAWWKDDRGPFHFQEDWQYAKQVDKFGHMLSGYMMSTLFSDVLMDCGFAHESAMWIGAGLGLSYQTYVEVEDGFAKDWGFSPSDAISNVLGAGMTVAQYYVPYLQNFTPRWNYIPSRWTGDNALNVRPANFIDDYNSATFWLAMNVDNMLPAEAADVWPDWLMVSVGYGIRDFDVRDASGRLLEPTARFMVGLDYNWLRIIPESSIGPLNYVRRILNHIRFPGPTLEFGPNGPTFRFLYPITISLGDLRF